MIEQVPPSERPAHPRTGYIPERVLRIALEGFREPNTPEECDGLRTVYHLLTPRFRWELGGYSGLEHFLETSLFDGIVGHDDEERGDITAEDGEAVQEVLIENGDEEYTYEFTMLKQDDGRYEGCWMIDEIIQLLPNRKPGFGHFPTVSFGDEELKCYEGDNLRSVLLEAAGVSPYNGKAQSLNCSGNSVCGTCAVEVENAEVDETVTDRTRREQIRINKPPFPDDHGEELRLACQTRVLDDLRVRKHQGLWGQHVEQMGGEDVGERDFGERVTVTEEEYDV